MVTQALVAKKRIKALCDSALAGTGVGVTYGPVRSPESSWCMVGKVTYDSTVWAAIGARRRSETFSVALMLNYKASGVLLPDAEAALIGWVGQIEAALRADPSLGGLTVGGVAMVPNNFNSQPLPDASEAQWEGVIRVSDVRI